MKKGAAENFIPYEPDVRRDGPDDGPGIKVMPKAGGQEGATDFAPFSAGLSNPASSGRGTANELPAHASHASNRSVTPTVTLQREGDRITGIRVECSCGQVIELACSY